MAATASYNAPHDIAGITTAVQVATSRLATCALLNDGTVSCWGDGFGTSPTLVAGVTGGVAISAGHFHFCVTGSSGAVQCFGGLAAGAEAMVPSPITDAAEATAFHSESCCRRLAGTVACWGAAFVPGQTIAPPLEPVVGLDDAVLVALPIACARVQRAAREPSRDRQIQRDELPTAKHGF